MPLVEFTEQLIVVLTHAVVFMKDATMENLIPLGDAMGALSV